MPSGVEMPSSQHMYLRRDSIADLGKHLANMYRQPHLWARLCVTRPSRFRHLVANR
jgi:hypothetical protein